MKKCMNTCKIATAFCDKMPTASCNHLPPSCKTYEPMATNLLFLINSIIHQQLVPLFNIAQRNIKVIFQLELQINTQNTNNSEKNKNIPQNGVCCFKPLHVIHWQRRAGWCALLKDTAAERLPPSPSPPLPQNHFSPRIRGFCGTSKDTSEGRGAAMFALVTGLRPLPTSQWEARTETSDRKCARGTRVVGVFMMVLPNCTSTKTKRKNPQASVLCYVSLTETRGCFCMGILWDVWWSTNRNKESNQTSCSSVLNWLQ